MSHPDPTHDKANELPEDGVTFPRKFKVNNEVADDIEVLVEVCRYVDNPVIRSAAERLEVYLATYND